MPLTESSLTGGTPPDTQAGDTEPTTVTVTMTPWGPVARVVPLPAEAADPDEIEAPAPD